MSVYRQTSSTGKEAWMVEINWPHPDGRIERIRKTSPVKTRKGAEAYERELRAALANGTYAKRKDEDVPTLEEFRKRFFASHVVNLREAVQEKHASYWTEHLVPAFGNTKLSEINAEKLSRFVASMRPRKPKTINNVLSSLNTALNLAAEWGVIGRDQVPSIPWQKVAQQKFDFFTFEEAAAVTTASGDERPWGPLIAFALNTGLRTGELRALRWRDVSPTHVTVSRAFSKAKEEPTKTGAVRSVPLNQAASAALAAIGRGKPGDFVFALEGRVMRVPEMRWPLWRACDQAGIGRRTSWHTTRHTFASHLVMRGVPIAVVQQLLGHTTIQMTMRYAHLAPGHLKSAVAALDTSP